MSELLFGLGLIVWLFAAYALLQIIRAQMSVWSMSKPGEGLRTTLALSSMNYPEVTARLGAPAEPHIERYRRGIGIFALAIGLFMIVLGVNIIAGRAA